ncbi:hypothetical protein LguiA_032180 [Lonicera macranthoides]
MTSQELVKVVVNLDKVHAPPYEIDKQHTQKPTSLHHHAVLANKNISQFFFVSPSHPNGPPHPNHAFL